MKRPLIVFFIILIASGIGIFYLSKIPSNPLQPQNPPQAWTEKTQAEYANTLLSKGLTAQAALAFQNYIEQAHLDKTGLAAICYRLGGIYMDLKEYELALTNFYKAELLNPQADYTARMNELIVEALENSGLSQQAQYELTSRTSVGKAADKKEPVAARIGKNEITELEIEQAIVKLPQWAQDNFKTKEGKLKFIKEYVSREVLYDKAKKIGLDKSAKTREYIEEIRKELAIQQLLQMQVERNLKISPGDLELYYKANKDKFVIPEAIKLSYIEISDETKKQEAISSLNAGKGTKVEPWIQKTDTSFAGVTEAKDAIAILIQQDKGIVNTPIKIKDKTYVFSIDDKRPQKDLSFDEVKGHIQREYQTQKEQELLERFLNKAIEQQEVEIFYKTSAEDEKTTK